MLFTAKEYHISSLLLFNFFIITNYSLFINVYVNFIEYKLINYLIY